MEFRIKQRWVLTMMCFFANLASFMMRSCLNISITQMVKEFDWDEETQGLILSSFFYGYFIMHVPGGVISERFGGKYTLGFGALTIALCTLVTPVCVRFGGWYALMALRAIEGLGGGVMMPAVNTLLAQWMPPSVKSRVSSIIYSGGQIGGVLGILSSGFIINEPSDWPAPFYIYGTITVLWFLLWIVLCYDNPNSHPFISEYELSYLRDTNGGERDTNLPMLPWKTVLTSVPVWALIITQIGHDYTYFLMATDLPKYMIDVLNFNIHKTAILAALPFIAMCCTISAFGYLFDKLTLTKKLTTLQARKTATAIAAVVPVICMLAACYAGYDTVAVIALFSVAMVFKGAFIPVSKINAIDLSPNYAGSVIAIVNGAGALAGMAAPYVVGVMTTNHTLAEWRTVFWTTLILQISTSTVYLIWADAQEQWWNNPSSSKSTNNKGLEAAETSLFIAAKS